jgi:isopentenyldiphosphate isomerase
MSEDEVVDIIDENDKVIGKTTKNIARGKNILHRGAHVVVFNSDGKLFVQKRSKTKLVHPGLWGLGAGGWVSSGEDYETAAKRELKEELGIKKGIKFLFDFRYKTSDDNYKSKFYKCIFDGKIKLQKEEIEKGEFRTINEIKNMSKKGLLCPDTAIFFEKYLEMKK